MNKVIDVTQEELIELITILRMHLKDEVVILFGSRINGRSHDHSDLDLAIKANEKVTWELISNLRESFENASFAFRVDFLDYHRISRDFQKIIDASGVVFDFIDRE